MAAAACAAAALAGAPARRFVPAPRFWRGNMCGTRVPGLEPVPGGAADASLVLSWFYDRYTPSSRRLIREAWAAKQLSHVLLSWPDARGNGSTPEQFAACCEELLAAGFFPCVMLTSKVYDDPSDPAALVAALVPLLALLVGRVPAFCVGWELSIWLTPTQAQALVDGIAPLVHRQAETRLYVHFQEGYGHFAQPGEIFAAYWNRNVGKLTGVLHQKVLKQTPEQYHFDSGGLVDILIRFAGHDFCSPDSGFGHPFDLVALEITATFQFAGVCTEEQGDAMGRWACAAPAQAGPGGALVGVMGSGNGL
jgi:hypothetical protein